MEYREVLDKTDELRAEIVSAYAAGDYRRAIPPAREIADLIAPGERALAGRVAYQLQTMASEMWFSGRETQPVKYAPPF